MVSASIVFFFCDRSIEGRDEDGRPGAVFEERWERFNNLSPSPSSSGSRSIDRSQSTLKDFVRDSDSHNASGKSRRKISSCLESGDVKKHTGVSCNKFGAKFNLRSINMDEDYAREITRHAVLRTSMALGFKSVREECLDVVGDVVRQFVQTIALRARDSAETGGRACGGIQDILPTLESMVRTLTGEMPLCIILVTVWLSRRVHLMCRGKL